MVEKEDKITQVDIPDHILQKWQNIVDNMASLIGVPAGLIMRIVEPDIEVFVSSKTSGNPYHPGDKEHLHESGLYCETVIKNRESLRVPNALSDKKWRNNPDIKLNMISYMGFPIQFPTGKAFGTICVLDNKENPYSDNFIQLIRNFAEIIESSLELIYMNHILGEKNKRFSDYLSEIKTLRGILPICSYCKQIRDDKGYWSQIESYIRKHSDAEFSHGICPECAKKHYPDLDLYEDEGTLILEVKAT